MVRGSRGRASILLLVVLALIVAVGYTVIAGTAVYQQLDSGRQELVAAQGTLAAASRASDRGKLTAAATQLKRAQDDFTGAQDRVRHDVALQAIARVGLAGRQLDATAHLAAIGADISHAGEAVAAIAIQVADLTQQYAGRPLTPDDLQGLLGQAQGIAGHYAGSARAIGQDLRAAHAERSAVNIDALLPPLKDAYNQVDAALNEADTAFLRYQDVRRLILDLLGISIPL